MVERRPRNRRRASRRSRVQSPAGAPRDSYTSVVPSVEKSEILGAMLGDKRRFAIRKRYGVYRRIDQARYLRGSLEISLGKDMEWGRHLSRLVGRAYGISGSIYRSKREWNLEVSSKRVVLDLSKYYLLSGGQEVGAFQSCSSKLQERQGPPCSEDTSMLKPTSNAHLGE